MIGVLNEGIRGFVTATYGPEVWASVIAAAGLDESYIDGFEQTCPYADGITYRVLGALSRHVGESLESVMEAAGMYTSLYHYGQSHDWLLRCMGSNIVEFLQNLNFFHLHLSLTFKDMRSPEFNVAEVTPESVVLHYASPRPGLTHYAVGLLRGTAKHLYGTDVTVSILRLRDHSQPYRNPEQDPDDSGCDGLDRQDTNLSGLSGDVAPTVSDHDTLLITFPRQPSLVEQTDQKTTCRLGLEPATLYQLFPFHLVLDTEGRVVQVGRALARLYPDMRPGRLLSDFFALRHPYIPINFDRIAAKQDSLFVLRSWDNGLELKGQMLVTSMPADTHEPALPIDSAVLAGASATLEALGRGRPLPDGESPHSRATVRPPHAHPPPRGHLGAVTDEPTPSTAASTAASTPGPVSSQPQAALRGQCPFRHAAGPDGVGVAAGAGAGPGPGSGAPGDPASRLGGAPGPGAGRRAGPAAGPGRRSELGLGPSNGRGHVHGHGGDPDAQPGSSSAASVSDDDCGGDEGDGADLALARGCRRAPGEGSPAILFLGNPRVGDMAELKASGLYMSDLPLFDCSREMLLMAEHRATEAAAKESFARLSQQLEAERHRSEQLLYQMIPPHIADALRRGERLGAETYPDATVLFSDIVGFTTIAAESTAMEVCNMLDELYNEFDALIDKYPQVYKVETIGDAYMLVANVTQPCDDHVDVVLDFALDMHRVCQRVTTNRGASIQIRVGIHSGSVVGGVVGRRMPRFHLFGDTVNTAARMESHGLPGAVHISAAARSRIRNPAKYLITDRGEISVKGKGCMETFLVSAFQEPSHAHLCSLLADTASLERAVATAMQSQGSHQPRRQPSREGGGSAATSASGELGAGALARPKGAATRVSSSAGPEGTSQASLVMSGAWLTPPDSSHVQPMEGQEAGRFGSSTKLTLLPKGTVPGLASGQTAYEDAEPASSASVSEMLLLSALMEQVEPGGQPAGSAPGLLALALSPDAPPFKSEPVGTLEWPAAQPRGTSSQGAKPSAERHLSQSLSASQLPLLIESQRLGGPPRVPVSPSSSASSVAELDRLASLTAPSASRQHVAPFPRSSSFMELASSAAPGSPAGEGANAFSRPSRGVTCTNIPVGLLGPAAPWETTSESGAEQALTQSLASAGLPRLSVQHQQQHQQHQEDSLAVWSAQLRETVEAAQQEASASPTWHHHARSRRMGRRDSFSIRVTQQADDLGEIKAILRQQQEQLVRMLAASRLGPRASTGSGGASAPPDEGRTSSPPPGAAGARGPPAKPLAPDPEEQSYSGVSVPSSAGVPSASEELTERHHHVAKGAELSSSTHEAPLGMFEV
ncbi:hypothetical protein HYH03_009640 [Edaphochlamys debaryana]|uniref:guanylate cyclase n=1 Tax=Edaphochlamys debaryana TaxID=47281 RepID=A0A835XYL2_9CHLO|nr:hypothetical protein HYH03_009640 [Edaphochlamys debaryana]|eukprot:KAG2492149.1 hypothetical protein HYH03_009640 [Edaphochlamys debaryana]